jgi:hypothetical protein
MSNPTTPFGWQMPTPTDLVTDLPADFEVFGQAVATDLQYLLGGTTGQVLAKASGTDLDFVWSADAAGMTNPMTTTADVIYSSSGSTPARLGIGTANQVLAVNSGATAPEWTTILSGGMTQLASGSLSSTVTNITSIDQTYTDLKLVLRLFFPSTAGQSCFIRVNANSGGTNYMSAKMRSNSTSIGQSAGDSGIFFDDFTVGSNASSSNQFAVIDFADYVNATTFKSINSYFNYAQNSTNTPVVCGGYGSYKVAEAITEINVHASGGNLSGSYILYGVK